MDFLVIVADDFGSTREVNLAVIKAHHSGVLTSASMMAGGEAFADALETAKVYRDLSLGLHLTLCDGKAVLSPNLIPDLADRDGYFVKSPVKAWFRYSNPRVLPQLEKEVDAQFRKLLDSGITPSHVDSHHHLHMHPGIFRIACRNAKKYGVEWVRLPNEPFPLLFNSRSLSRGLMPFIEWPVFKALRRYNINTARGFGLKCACRTYGLSGTGDLDMEYMEDILKYCPGNFINEIFVHPDLSTPPGLNELKVLRSNGLRERISSYGLTLAGYAGLSRAGRLNCA